jgi:malate/lactate dehydrogenase
LASKGLCSLIVLKDIRENIVEAMALDISQAANTAKSHTMVKAAISGEDLKDCEVIVITAGIPRKSGMSRDDSLLTNSKIMQAVLHNNKKIYLYSVMLDGEYDYKNVVSGVPVMLGANGVEKIIELKLNEEQKELFANSVASVQELIDTLDEKFFI